MALIVAIHDARFSGGQNLADERSFILFAVGKENLLGNAAIEIKTDVNLGLLGAVPVIGPIHGQNGIDQGAVDNGQIAQLGMSFGQLFCCFPIELPEQFHHLLQSPRADVFEEAALFNAIFRGYVLPGKIILLENLQKMTSRMMFFEMEINQDVDLVFKSHLQGPVASGCQRGKIG